MYAKTVLEHRVQLVYTGRAQANFSPKAGGGVLAPRLDRIRGIIGGGEHIYASRLNFTGRWLEVDETKEWTYSERLLWRSVEPADGMILRSLEHGMMGLIKPMLHAILVGFNADCPFGVILWPDGRLGFCHLGLECILPKDGRPGIIDTAGLQDGCVVHITAGIGPCCYGKNDGGFDYVFERFPEAQGGTAIRGPRNGQPSLDLHRLIRSVLARHDITVVSEDGFCTACAATPDGKPLYYSNVADRNTTAEGSRNCVAVRRIGF